MFSIGDKVVYGFDGVYTVSEYTSSPIDKNDTRQFYLLRPVYGPVGDIVITPIENKRIRAVMSREEALAFIDRFPDMPTLTVEKEKNRRETYRKALDAEHASVDVLVSIIKTVKLRREELAKIKKRVSESDNDYEKKAKTCLHGELSVSLDISLGEVEEFIENRLASVNV